MGFGSMWGLVVPRSEDEDGKLYMVLGKLVISASAKDIHQVGDEMLVNAWMFTNGGGATMDNEWNYVQCKLMRSLGVVALENQARI